MYRRETRRILFLTCIITALFTLIGPAPVRADDSVDLTHATLVMRNPTAASAVERTAVTVLAEEVQKRTGAPLHIATRWPTEAGGAIAILFGQDAELQGVPVPAGLRTTHPEGYGIATNTARPGRPVVWVVGADPRGTLYGVGRLLRNLACRKGSVRLVAPLNLTSAPDLPIRGHQLGYRATANSYDAWSPEQFDQYIRELTFFGVNSIEGIPFQDTRPTVNSFPRSQMNVLLSRSCERYGLDYWVWVPADFDLKDAKLRSKALQEHEGLFRDCPTLTGVFVPGGDPGDNPAELVIPYLADLAKLLAHYHPKAKVWLSLQGYSPAQQDYVYRWIERERPSWLGGLVAGPSSPPLADVRARLPRPYALRDYPDITHSVRCQFPVPWWDPAYAFTLGRECVNPRPLFFARIVQDTAAYTNGFISYSDGIHDDVNKIVWSALAWDRSADLNTVLTEYSRVYFGSEVADAAASGIFALERNWDGALATNGGVDVTFAFWHELEGRDARLKTNWRWQLCLLRAYYDTYTRQRLLYESRLEDEANARLLAAHDLGVEKAITQALEILQRAETAPVRQELASRITQLCDDLYKSIGLQTSVEKYHASGSERGAVLDFLNYPLNNRWWLEDELAKVRKMSDEGSRVARLETLAKWENPGPGSFYDDIGNIAKSPHEIRNEKVAGPLLDVDNMALPGFMFWVGNDPLARARQSWFSDEGWPTALKYTALDPQADYVVRTTGCGDCFLRVNGVRLAPTLDGRKVGEIKEFPVPRGLYRDGALTVTFDPTYEPNLNWRVQSRLTEIWLIKK
ncbi:MAG TPA: hypothetical protein VKU00_27630 [Chthonomonadaceae bacterium]|nr:hypothetical protein [Chthonomonadaceae bacterium]